MKKIQKIKQALVGFRGSVLRFYNDGVHKPVQFWMSCGSPQWCVPRLPWWAQYSVGVHRGYGLVPVFSPFASAVAVSFAAALVAQRDRIPTTLFAASQTRQQCSARFQLANSHKLAGWRCHRFLSWLPSAAPSCTYEY